MSAITQTKTKRNELQLPILHFVVIDQWKKVIGTKAIFAWLELYTMAKRDEEVEGVNKWEEARVPMSINKLIKVFGVGRDTFYNKILKPLWNVGLIDLVEYKDSENKGTKPVNVIVYKYPQNNKELATKELVAFRDYDKDYNSEARVFAKLGGRPKSNTENVTETKNETTKNTDEKLQDFVGKKRVFRVQTRGSSIQEHNNSNNSFSNNINNNISNNNINYSSSSRKRKEKEEKVSKLLNKNISYKILYELLEEKGFEKTTIVDTILELNKQNIDMFSMNDIHKQINLMMEKIMYGDTIYSFAVYFANGLKKLTELSRLKRVYAYEKEKELQYIKERSERNSGIYYNWLLEENQF